MLLYLALMAAVSSAPAAHSKPPYSAQVVFVDHGKTTTSKIWSDGVRTKSESVDDKGSRSGSLTDESKNVRFLYGPSFGCLQMAAKPTAAMHAKIDEQFVANETVDGHPTKKFKVTTSAIVAGKAFNDVSFEWRATDLGDLVIRRRALDGSTEMNLRSIVVGKPDPSLFSMPSGCKYDEMADTTSNDAGAAGGYRTIRFSDASCKKLIPLPVTMSIPSDYAIRGSRMGCFWGTDADLDRVLKSDEEADFDSIQRGVFWCRVSDSTEYDPGQKRFTSSDGTDDQWPAAYRAAGARDVAMKRMTVGGFPAFTVSAKVRGSAAYMLYIGVEDSPAILINYHPPAHSTSSADQELWQHFLESIHDAPK